MAKKQETYPIREYVVELLRKHREAAIQIRVGLNPEYKDIIPPEGHKIYDAAVMAVYSVISSMDLEGQETVDPKQLRALRDGLEDFVVKAKR